MQQERGLGRRFTAELDMCDLDDRFRAGPSWAAKSVAISRSRLWLRSRRMCYPDARIAATCHLIDAEPVVLVGVVRACEYDSDSLYELEIELQPPPNREVLESIRSRAAGSVAA